MKLYKDKLLFSAGLVSALFSFIIYLLTKAPTVSFWDCGEFIACSNILGIPHPPGAPLFVLLGRFFIILPLPFSAAVSVNFISVVASAAAVYVAYWLIIRMIVGFEIKQLSLHRRIALAIGGLAGGLIMAFSATWWDNAIEAEVYGAAMFLMLTLCYLLLIWSSRIGKPGAGRYLVLISYLSFLSIGFHLTTFLVMPVFIAYMALKDKNLLTDFRFWIVWITLLIIVVSFDMFFWGMISLLVVLGFAAFSKTRAPYRWGLAFAVVAAAAVGYSTHLYIPIRAAEKPAINENNPSNWRRFKYFLERKQYGQESMITRAMTRRGSWANQFGTKERMGLWGFFHKQYSTPELAFIFFAFGIWGIYAAFKRSWIDGSWLFLLLFLSTVGLLYYLNFSDGTRGAQIEVRDRDYFYTPGFMFFAIFIGIGIGSLFDDIVERLKNSRFQSIAVAAFAVLILLMPLHSLMANYADHDRSNNWIPWDYAYNILNSVDQDGILFTNGDNDTFPLWFLQEVERIRRDVRVVNLSLLNTPWYIHQLKEQMGVPITFTYDQIERLMPRWLPDKQKLWRVQDEMILHILKANNGRYPIYFALTVAEENRLGMEENFIMEGMAYRVVASKGKGRVNAELAWQRYMETFRYRGLGDSTVHKTENDIRLVANYVSGFMQLADTLKRGNDLNRAIMAMKKAIAIFPDEWRSRAYTAGLYALAGMPDSIDWLVEKLPDDTKEKVFINAAQELMVRQDYSAARPYLYRALSVSPGSEMAYRNLLYAEKFSGNSAAFDSLASVARIRFKDNRTALANIENTIRSLQSRRN